MLSAPYMTTIQPPAPVQNAIIAKMNGRFPGAIDWAKMSAPSRSCSRNEPGLTVGSSMNSQTRTAAAPARAPGHVEEEAEARRDPVRAAVEEERETDDEDHQRGEPDARVDEDVLERRDEAEVVVRPHEVVEADEAAADVGEGEVERVDRRRDAEDDQERQVGQDERQPT